MINSDFNNIFELLKAFPDEQSCINHLTVLRWNGNVVSPFDSVSKVYVCKGNKYKCKNTGKYFNVKTGTMFDNTKIALQKWFMAIYIVTSHKKGISSVQLGKDIGVTQKSAWFMLQRIRACFGIDNNDQLTGTVQVDETYIGGEVANMTAKRKTNINLKTQKTPVIGMISEGEVRAEIVKNNRKESLLPVMKREICKTSIVVTDGLKSYDDVPKHFIKHVKIRHSANQYVNNGFHTNSIEGFWSIFKRGVYGIYHHVSKKHLSKYLDEFTFRYNTRNFSTEGARMNLLLCQLNTRTKYKDLING